jgi:hypothetical protein
MEVHVRLVINSVYKLDLEGSGLVLEFVLGGRVELDLIKLVVGFVVLVVSEGEVAAADGVYLVGEAGVVESSVLVPCVGSLPVHVLASFFSRLVVVALVVQREIDRRLLLACCASSRPVFTSVLVAEVVVSIVRIMVLSLGY